ncbi:MAG: FMN-binding glutamate synthase family protein, partial [Bdellovibrionales bacterium]|nr:FMN-binding glutamate synthase family protein [Bdellovibrionales bacterium]
MRKYFYIALVFFLVVIISGFLILPESYRPVHALVTGILLFISYLGIVDIIQEKHTIRRNFPVLGRFRYILESVRPEISQYFVESNTDGRPFNRNERSIIYQRAKGDLDTVPFGTQLDVEDIGYEWVNHSITAKHINYEDLRVTVGGPDCKQPYSSSLLNISAMSFGALSKNAILALNGGAKLGNFAHNTGEGSISDYHLQPGGDLTWQIGTGYFGCRTKDGHFNPETFQKRATLPQVKMIEIKLSQGAKPGHGGILPGVKVTPEIAKIRDVPVGQSVLSPPAHTAFSTPIELLQFVKQLRDLSGGKPVGFKLCIGHKSEFISICLAMIHLDIYPDFITVDGGEGGTGAAPQEFSNYIGAPMIDGLAFVHNILNGLDIRKYIKLIASGKITSGFHIARAIALGADTCNSARAMMMALGCIQALLCNTNRCPTGIATQDPNLTVGLVVDDKKVRVANYHEETIKSFVEMLGASGLDE